MKKLHSIKCFRFKQRNKSINRQSNPLILFSDIKTHNWIIVLMKMSAFLPSISLPTTDRYMFGSVHNLNSGDSVDGIQIDDIFANDCSWLSFRSGIPILIISVYSLRFIAIISLQLLEWRYLTVISCPTLTTTSHCISATVCLILFFAKKCQIEEVIIISSSFLRPMPFSAKFDVRLYSILMFLLLGFAIIVEFITNSLQLTQWDRHLYRMPFTHYADNLLVRHQYNAIFGYIFHLDLVLQHFFAVILLIAKVLSFIYFVSESHLTIVCL